MVERGGEGLGRGRCGLGEGTGRGERRNRWSVCLVLSVCLHVWGLAFMHKSVCLCMYSAVCLPALLGWEVGVHVQVCVYVCVCIALCVYLYVLPFMHKCFHMSV